MSVRGEFARAAVLIAILTVLARITGFARNLVFARTVGNTCLGQTYQSMNTIPNIVFEIVAGGALASVVVPLLSAAIGRGDRVHAARTASALLTWAIAILVPIAVLIAVLAEPIASALLGDNACANDPRVVAAGATMLQIFAPQIVLYGIGIVLTGILQAHRKFGGPALAPLLSSLVVIGAYVMFAVAAGAGAEVAETSAGQRLILSAGTTLGVVVLSLSLVVPAMRLPIPLRPTLRFPPGVARRARSLAMSGVIALAAQQASVAVTLVLTNRPGVPTASINVYTYAQTIYLLPWAVLAVPVATSYFPKLSEDADTGNMAGFRQRYGQAQSAIMALAAIAAAALIAAAPQIAYVYVQSAPGVPSATALEQGIAGFSAGLVGYSMFAIASRGLYALGDARGNAVAALAGWGTVIAASLILAALLPDRLRVLALTAATAVGVSVLGLALSIAVQRRCGGAPLRAVVRIVGAAVLAGGIGYGVYLLELPGYLALSDQVSIVHALISGCVRALLAAGVCTAALMLLPDSPIRAIGALRRGEESR